MAADRGRVKCRSYAGFGWRTVRRVGSTVQPKPSMIKMSKLNLTDTSAADEYATVYVAFELSKAEWKLGVLLPGSQKMSRYTIDGGDLAALSTCLAQWREKA